MSYTLIVPGVDTTFSTKLNNNFLESFRLITINAGQAAINALVGGGNLNMYDLLHIDYFSDADGCLNTIESSLATGTFLLKRIIYDDDFTNTGCSLTTSPSCLMTYCYKGTTCVTCNVSNCLCATVSYSLPACTTSCLTICNYDSPYSNCYILDVDCLQSKNSDSVCRCHCGCIKVGNYVLYSCYYTGSCIDFAGCCYELQKVDAVCCYEIFNNGVSQGCSNIDMSSGVIAFCIITGGRTGVSVNSCLVLNQVSALCPDNYVQTNEIDFTNAPDYIVTTTMQCDAGATNPGSIVYDLLCCDDTVACCCLSVNTPYSITAIGESCYKLKFYNGCQACNIESNGICMRGYATQGMCY